MQPSLTNCHTFKKEPTMTFSTKATLLAAALLSVASVAQAQSDQGTLSVGIKTWITNWNGNHVGLIGNSYVAEHLNTNSPKTVFIPSIQYRRGDFGVSASVLTSTNFNLSSSSVTASLDRSEYDVSAQYFMLPNVALSAGYKQLKWDGIPAKGPFVGISASAPINNSFSLYASLGLGSLKAQEYSSGYQLAEAGVAYSLGGLGPMVKSAAITAGYRTQRLKVNGIKYPNGQTFNLTDSTNGFTFSFVASF